MTAPIDSRSDRLTRELVGADLWNYMVRDSEIEKIWSEPDSLSRLTAIVRDAKAPAKARFAACEVLFEREFTFIGTVGESTVAAIYVDALLHDLTGMANSWGLLYEEDDPGPVGARFLMLGDGAIQALRPLLADGRAGPSYAGSEEATVGNAYHYRIKDFAAFYLGMLARKPIGWIPDVTARDQAIAALARSLESH